MSTSLVGLIAALAGAVLVWGLREKQRILTFPVLTAFVYIGWLLPQAVVVLNDPKLPADGVIITMTMAVLALLAIIAGWRCRHSAVRKMRADGYRYSIDRMLLGVVALSAAGAYFSVRLWSLPEDLLQMSQWSGPQTILQFFAKMQWMALALAWLLWLRHRRQSFLLVALFNLAFLLEPVFLGARRAGMAELALILLTGLWFVRRWLPGRAVLVAGCVAAILVVNAIGAVRDVLVPVQFAKERPPVADVVNALSDIDYTQNTLSADQIAAYELKNAVYINATAHQLVHFCLGTAYWDILVHSYVPAQWLGHDFKNSLRFDCQVDWQKQFNTRFHTGTTTTGLADTFGSFWFFGAIVFYVSSRMLRWLFDLAERGTLWAQYAYAVLIVDGLHMITHHTGSFFAHMPQLVVFSLPIFLFAKLGRQRRTPLASMS